MPFNGGLHPCNRVDKILSAENPIKSPTNPVRIDSLNDKIEYRDISFKYNADWVIKDVNLTIKKGQTVALVGQSGSGKSTMADLLPRFYDVEKGGIFIDGVNIKDMAVFDLREMWETSIRKRYCSTIPFIIISLSEWNMQRKSK